MVDPFHLIILGPLESYISIWNTVLLDLESRRHYVLSNLSKAVSGGVRLTILSIAHVERSDMWKKKNWQASSNYLGDCSTTMQE